MKRDFTFIDDIVQGVIRTLDRVAEPDPAYNADLPDPGRSNAPFRVFNIGSNNPVELMGFIEPSRMPWVKGRKTSCPCRTATCRPPMPTPTNSTPGPVSAGHPVRGGIGRFVEWYRSYYKLDFRRGRPALSPRPPRGADGALTVSLVLYRPDARPAAGDAGRPGHGQPGADPSPDLFLIDNGGSAAALAGPAARRLDVHVISGHGNVGFGAATTSASTAPATST